MTLKLLQPIDADGEIIPAGKVVKIYDPETAQQMIRQGIGRPANPADVWPEPMVCLVQWFLNATLPEEPFSPSGYEHILHPATYYESLRRDIEAGPKGPRSRYGALQDDLQRLKAYCEVRRADS